MPFGQSTHHAIFGPNRELFKNLAWLTRYQRKLERLKKSWQQNLGFDLEMETGRKLKTTARKYWSLNLFILLVNWKSRCKWKVLCTSKLPCDADALWARHAIFPPSRSLGRSAWWAITTIKCVETCKLYMLHWKQDPYKCELKINKRFLAGH